MKKMKNWLFEEKKINHIELLILILIIFSLYISAEHDINKVRQDLTVCRETQQEHIEETSKNAKRVGELEQDNMELRFNLESCEQWCEE